MDDLTFIEIEFRVFDKAYEVFDDITPLGIVAKGSNNKWYSHDSYGNYLSGHHKTRKDAIIALSEAKPTDRVSPL